LSKIKETYFYLALIPHEFMNKGKWIIEMECDVNITIVNAQPKEFEVSTYSFDKCGGRGNGFISFFIVTSKETQLTGGHQI
jgi:hypothetical protein